jgi:hypothetical protein
MKLQSKGVKNLIHDYTCKQNYNLKELKTSYMIIDVNQITIWRS